MAAHNHLKMDTHLDIVKDAIDRKSFAFAVSVLESAVDHARKMDALINECDAIDKD